MTITISATALADGVGGVDYNTYLVDYFADLADGASTFYGGTPDSFFGSTYYMNGDEIGFDYATTGGAETDNTAVLVGDDLAYDFIHYGAAYGHGITGTVTGLEFGFWTDETTAGEDGHGLIENLATALEISGLDLYAAPGAGNDTTTNEVYALYKAVQTGDYSYIYDLLASEGQEFLGSTGGDSYVGTDFKDVARGVAGADYLEGGMARDRLFGNAGNDELDGGDGNDLLVGGRGDDTLTGGKHADTFRFGPDSGDDVVTDYQVGKDVLDFDQYGADAQFDTTESDGNTVITITDGDDVATVTLLGVTDFTYDFLV